MAIQLSKEEVDQVVPSIQKYFQEELEQEISAMRARFLLEYFLKEIAPFAYNQGVRDAERFIRARLEDLSGACYEEALTYWRPKRK